MNKFDSKILDISGLNTGAAKFERKYSIKCKNCNNLFGAFNVPYQCKDCGFKFTKKDFYKYYDEGKNK